MHVEALLMVVPPDNELLMDVENGCVFVDCDRNIDVIDVGG